MVRKEECDPGAAGDEPHRCSFFSTSAPRTTKRSVARSRAHDDAREFVHRAKVGAEIAHIAPEAEAEMDVDVVRAVDDDELDRHRPGSTHRI